MSLPRVSPPKVFPRATRAAKPPLDAAGSGDAYRQSTFVLLDDIEAVVAGLNFEGQAAEASAGSKFRTHQMASALGLWSRSWLSRLEALHAAEWGNYASAVTLVRAAADYQAGMLYLLRSDAAEWREWLEVGGVGLATDVHATEFRLHAFRAAEVLAAHEVLGRVYRLATDLSLPHFGATLLLAGNDSAPDHLVMTFGDRDYHHGWAQLVTGWLLELGSAQCEELREFEGTFAAVGDEATRWAASASEAAKRADRCRIEVIEREGERRYLVHNWRREPRSAARKILL